jgi:spermidine synthase
MAAQYGFANIPVMFCPRVRDSDSRALVIGMGTGTTLGALAAFPFERVDVAELSPGIIEAARTFFGGINRHVLDDPRVSVLFEDGRNVLLVKPTTYDLISIELTSIWFAGAGNLYNREFYEIAKARLREGGVLQQWVQLHHTTRREIATTLATAREVFPHGILFVRGEQGILVLGEQELVADRVQLEELERVPGVQANLGEGRLADAMADAVLADETLDRFVDDVAREEGSRREALISTDDNLRLEYATPRNNVPGRMSTYETGAMLRALREDEVMARHIR